MKLINERDIEHNALHIVYVCSYVYLVAANYFSRILGKTFEEQKSLSFAETIAI